MVCVDKHFQYYLEGHCLYFVPFVSRDITFDWIFYFTGSHRKDSLFIYKYFLLIHSFGKITLLQYLPCFFCGWFYISKGLGKVVSPRFAGAPVPLHFHSIIPLYPSGYMCLADAGVPVQGFSPSTVPPSSTLSEPSRGCTQVDYAPVSSIHTV